MNLASASCRPAIPVLATRSLPAKSTICNLDLKSKEKTYLKYNRKYNFNSVSWNLHVKI